MRDSLRLIARYHSSFHGDTYDACARCGGQCEQFKISTLIPNEKEYIARHLGIPVSLLEDKYLDELDTPFGRVDVLKMKNGCPFLDRDLRCTVVEAKPILCDSYPITFEVSGSKVHFEIDRRDCPMVQWPEYAQCVRRFTKSGIPAMRRLKVPLAWWKVAALYDEFDFDYARIEKELRHTARYESFMVEEVLGFACNGYEERARRRGLGLLDLRLRSAAKENIAKLDQVHIAGNAFARRLIGSYRSILRTSSGQMRAALASARRDPNLLSEPSGFKYRLLAVETKASLERIAKDSESLQERMRETLRITPAPETQRKGMALGGAPPRAFSGDARIHQIRGADAFEVFGFDDRMALDGYVLLAGQFAPDEIDDPTFIHETFLKAHRRGGTVSTLGAGRERRNLWYRWIMAVLRDQRGRVVSAADGAVIANKETTLFYASHIATLPGFRSKGLGAVLTARILQAANDHLGEARVALGGCRWRVSDGVALQHELGEIEFPDPTHTGAATISRLRFHGKVGRSVLWPLRYAQPDTDYSHRRFDPDRWNSVPMFICHRAFRARENTAASALGAVSLLFDYFSVCADKVFSQGVEWDRANLTCGLRLDGRPRFIKLPSTQAGVQRFIQKTGYMQAIIPRYYPNHLNTRDRRDMIDVVARLRSRG